MKKGLFITCLIGCLFLLSGSDAQACFCITPEVAHAFREARSVFSGEVIEIIEPRVNKSDAPLTDRLYSIRFKVEKLWKGATAQEIVVLSDQGRAGCFSWGPFEKGKKYLVYAERRTPAGARTKNLVVLFSCNRTSLLDSATQDLKVLETIRIKTRHTQRPFP